MHEMSLTHDVLDTVLTQANLAEATKVVGVHMTVGEVHDIVDDLFAKCFNWLARGTIAEEAKVVIDRVPLTVRCKECDEVYGVSLYRRETPCCPACGGPSYAINTGEEFFIDDIEVL